MYCCCSWLTALQIKGIDGHYGIQKDLMLLGPNRVRPVNKAEQLGLDVARAPDPAGLQHRGTGAIDLQFLNLTDLLDRPELKLDKTIVRETVRGCRVMVTGAGDRKSTRLNSSH